MAFLNHIDNPTRDLDGPSHMAAIFRTLDTEGRYPCWPYHEFRKMHGPPDLLGEEKRRAEKERAEKERNGEGEEENGDSQKKKEQAGEEEELNEKERKEKGEKESVTPIHHLAIVLPSLSAILSLFHITIMLTAVEGSLRNIQTESRYPQPGIWLLGVGSLGM
jgi:hypothetical protein